MMEIIRCPNRNQRILSVEWQIVGKIKFQLKCARCKQIVSLIQEKSTGLEGVTDFALSANCR